ncbi:family 2 glycosyltransferase [Cryphonectria parasitica EP155]|uniref:chitin synthase n=1 Tax=Cryphonectria parasitica (strain ATCC 38755 / EP155) TaxID=660469 RepID=A0A9P4Y818_CRYP1|nr:family 2 glycosyltransferase [Cryphonectria parasitica EP155]KAF3768175.1 family 2 glycosyltransferase [Cryphonectria parasitica EP155]
MANRMSMYSVASEMHGASRGTGQQSTQVSTTTLLNSIHNIYIEGQAYGLDASSSVVVNTWLTANPPPPNPPTGGTIDTSLGVKAWEHARRRAEDGAIILSSLHTSTPSVLVPFLSNALPIQMPSMLFKALEAIHPFIRCVTPNNPSTPRQAALAVTLTLNLAGEIQAASVALSQGGIDTDKGLLNIPAEAGYRAFDVFYYLLNSGATPAEREFLSLKSPDTYTLLKRSGTYEPPSYLINSDDGAAADDFRDALKQIGIKGSAHRNLISTLAGVLKLGNTLDYNIDEDAMDDIIEDAGGLLGVEPEVLATQCSTEDRQTFIGGLYEALVDWVITKANAAIAAEMGHPGRAADDNSSEGGVRTPNSDDNQDTVCITVLEIPDPDLGKALALRGVFDDSLGINAEMNADGVEVPSAGSSVVREMQNAVAAVAPDLGIMSGPAGRERLHVLEKREEILEKLAYAADEDGFLKKLLFPVEGEGINLGRNARADLPAILSSSRAWYHLSIHPTDDAPATIAGLPSITSAWSAGTVSRQLRSWRLPEWSNRRNRNLDFTADFDHDEFVTRYSALGCSDGKEGIQNWLMERGWTNGEVIVGNERVWMHESAWWEAEMMIDSRQAGPGGVQLGMGMSSSMGFHGLDTGYSAQSNGSGFFGQSPFGDSNANDSNEGLAQQRNRSQATFLGPAALGLNPGSRAPSLSGSQRPQSVLPVHKGDYGLGFKGDYRKGEYQYNAEGQFVGGVDPELLEGKNIKEERVTLTRRVWVAFVWALTFWIPSPLLSFIGRMKRPDVRMAWREKVVLCFLITLINCFIIFWIVIFGNLICPNYDKALNFKEVAEHTGDNDFYVSIRGNVYDISKFWKTQHSDSSTETTTTNMEPFAGENLDEYFVPPLIIACPGLVTDDTIELTANTTPTYPTAEHTSGYYQADTSSALRNTYWYNETFLPKIKEYYKAELVWEKEYVKTQGADEYHNWVIYNNKVFDLTDYVYTLSLMDDLDTYEFLNSNMTSIAEENYGLDVTDKWNALIKEAKESGNSTEYASLMNSLTCMENTFYKGIIDFRYSAKCQFNNYLLLAFTILLCTVILIKFLSALQFGSKRRPSPQDKFVICQVPAYTEGEDSLRKALDSLTALQYDNKRKLICVICDGLITGAGNDRPTPKIVLDILGVDPKVDPPALPFKSVGAGGLQLNYGKVYSGLYEFEGNVVPYIVVVKCGREVEQTQTKPGNRGKRDSQILLMSFLNRVHHRAPMSPLELEMFHQINNIIGVDPELYEYLLMIDADTCVREDSLNRLVARCANNAKIAGICGETSLQNEERSWWTMIQVYEYFISHNLAKAFESLFGSVTCLPGCFTMYRLRTADRGKPLIISDEVIRDYSDCHVDTLHKKNLLSLGEDRYLTTLMTKHFPHMQYKFTADAYCQTAAPETWSVLLSQRRRWINSTIHNLAELMRLKDMCGFCCFSMRFVVLIDLTGTIILPATTCYLGYLIYRLATHQGQFPTITIAMLAGVYGLQALIFILKRQWQHVGWMIIYILAYPVYSFILPIYSFWNQDNFSWGNTRVVIGEKGQKQIVAEDDEAFDPRSIPLQRWDDYALQNNLPGRRGNYNEKGNIADTVQPLYDPAGGMAGDYELDDMKSVYSSVRQPSILTGVPGRGAYMAPPQSPAPFQTGHMSRNSAFTAPYADHPASHMHRQSTYSVGTGLDRDHSPYQDRPGSTAMGAGYAQSRAGTAMSGYGGASPSVVDFSRGPGVHGPDDAAITECIQAVLREVDLDTITKKQVRALVEQRLQTELVGERRTFMDRQIDNELANM